MYLKNIEINRPVLEDKIDILERRLARFDKTKKYLLSFSCGKDSEVLFHFAKTAGLNIIPVHYFIIPDLSYNEEILLWFENQYGIKINRIESAIYTKAKQADLLCINKIWDIKATKMNPFKRNEKLSHELFGYDYNLVGIKKADSPNRAINISAQGWFQEGSKKIYPLFDWSDRDVWSAIKHLDLPINKCYEWFGRSLDVLNLHHLYPLKQYVPDDYKKFCREFPLIEPMVWLYEKRMKEENKNG